MEDVNTTNTGGINGTDLAPVFVWPSEANEILETANKDTEIVHLTTEGVDAPEKSTEIEHVSLVAQNATHAEAWTTDTANADDVIRVKIVCAGLCFSLAVNIMLLIGNGKVFVTNYCRLEFRPVSLRKTI